MFTIANIKEWGDYKQAVNHIKSQFGLSNYTTTSGISAPAKMLAIDLMGNAVITNYAAQFDLLMFDEPTGKFAMLVAYNKSFDEACVVAVSPLDDDEVLEIEREIAAANSAGIIRVCEHANVYVGKPPAHFADDNDTIGSDYGDM